MEAAQLLTSRQQLIRVGLIAYEKPLYQVLDLERADAPRSGSISVAQLMRQALGGAS
jgi:hypothetical protein